MKTQYLHWMALVSAILAMTAIAHADSPTDNWVSPNSSILKDSTQNWSTGLYPRAGNIGVFNDTGSTNGSVLGLDISSGGSLGTFGAIDLTGVKTGVPTEQLGTYNPNSGTTNVNATWTLGGATLNSEANTIIANSSGTTLSIQNDAKPSNKNANTGTLTIALGNSSNVIQTSGTGSNITISTVLTDGSGASGLTFIGSGSNSLNLNAANTYSGGTTVQSGSLTVSNVSGLGGGAVTVSGGALSTTVQSVGVGGTLSLSSGSIALNAGASPTLQLALNQNFTMSGGTLSLTLGSGSLGSIAANGGGFTISSGTINLNNSLSSSDYGSSYDVLTGFNSGSSSVSGLAITGYDSTDYTAVLDGGGVLSFDPVATPEPGFYGMLLGGLLLVAGVRALRGRGAVAAGGLAVAVLAVLGTGKASAQEFTAGDIVVSIYGDPPGDSTAASYQTTDTRDGGTIQDGAPTPITLEEFSPTISANADNGTALVTDTLPLTDGVGGSQNVGIVGEYGSSSEGTLSLSGNGQYLAIGGYDATESMPFWNSTGTALAQSPSDYGNSNVVSRVATLIDANGNVNSSTVLDNIYETENLRAVYTATGSSLYVSGQSDGPASTQGIFTVATGDNTSTGGGTAPAQIYNLSASRSVGSDGTNIYYAVDQKNVSTGVFEYSGTPNGANQPITTPTATVSAATVSGSAFTINSGTAKLSPEGFFFASPTVLYVADTGDPKNKGTGDGGIQKWVQTSGTWTLQYTITSPTFVNPTLATSASSGETGLESITGEVVGGQVYLYGVSYTAGDDNADGLYGLVDSLSATAPLERRGIDGTGRSPGRQRRLGLQGRFLCPRCPRRAGTLDLGHARRGLPGSRPLAPSPRPGGLKLMPPGADAKKASRDF